MTLRSPVKEFVLPEYNGTEGDFDLWYRFCTNCELFAARVIVICMDCSVRKDAYMFITQ